MQQNTDEIVPDPAIPRPDQEEMSIQLIDIHLYKISQEEIKSIESTLQETEETAQPEVWQEQKEPLKKQPKRTLSAMLLVLIALSVLVSSGGSLAYFLLCMPTVTITIIPKSVQVETTGTITIDTSTASPSNGEIPGRLLPAITMSQTQTIATTGTTYQEARSGRGTITFYNAALYPQTIAAGTLLTGADGTQVVTDQAVTVPAVSYPTLGAASVSAHAVQPGPSGNIKAGDIYGPCCLQNISAENHVFTGGLEASTYQSVSEPDIESAGAHLLASLTQAVTAVLSTQVYNSETLITPPTCQPKITADHEVGDKATQVQVTEALSCTALAYDTASFRQRITQALQLAADNQKLANARLEGVPQATIQGVGSSDHPFTYTLTVQSHGRWVSQFSQSTLSHLAASLAGKNTREATQFLLRTPGIQQVSLSQTSPLPSDPQKIHFLVLMQ
jgi:Baseplate J-like protein